MRACAVLTLAALLSTATAAQAPAWFAVRTPHLEVASAAGPEAARSLGVQLERTLDLAAELLGADPARLAPIEVLTLPSADGYEFLRPLSGEPAFLHAQPDRTLLVLDADLPEHALSAAQHALVHLVAASDPQAHRPLWLEEGAAELFSTARTAGDAVEIGRPPRARVEWFALATLHPLRRVITARETLRWSQHAREGFAAESWAFLHFLREGAQLGFPPREDALGRYLALVGAGTSPELACQDAFGASAAELEAELLRYLSYGELPRRRVPLASLERFRVEDVGPVAPAQRFARLGLVAAALGEPARTPAERWLGLASSQSPRAAARLAQLRAERGDAADLVQPLLAETELAAARDAVALQALGLARLALAERSAPPDAAQLAEAARLLAASRTLAPSRVGTQLALARLALARGERSEAEALLTDARERAPTLAEIDVALARVALAEGDSGDAQRHLARVLERPHEDARGTSAAELEELLRRARVDTGGPVATRHLTAHLEVIAPPAVRGVSEVEISGRGGRWEAAFHDVVIALDESESTLIASGRDIDGDGRASRNKTWERHVVGLGLVPFQAAREPGDAVVSAEVAAGQRLLAQLDPDAMRVALVTFAGDAFVDVPLGPPAVVARQLASFSAGFHNNGTSIAEGLRGAFAALNAGRDPERARHRAILLLSDGQPTVPTREKGAEEALGAADDLARYGVPVHAFAIGPAALARADLYREIATRTGGRFVAVPHPAEVVSLLRSVKLTGLDEIALRNLTTGQSGSDFRVLPDGSFRARLPLALGANSIEVRARIEGREPLVVKRQLIAYAGEASADALAPQLPRDAEPGASDAARERELRENRSLEIEIEERRAREQAEDAGAEGERSE